MSPSCPISNRSVDSNMVRVISFQVALFTLLLLLSHETFFALVLLFDFAVRGLRRSQWSPFQIIATFVLKGWGIAPKLCDESPKRFALYLGLIISLLLVILSLTGLVIFTTVVAIILLFCAVLETAFDFCIGCKLYYFIQLGRGFLNR